MCYLRKMKWRACQKITIVDVKILRILRAESFRKRFRAAREALRLRWRKWEETLYTVVATFDPVLAHLWHPHPPKENGGAATLRKIDGGPGDEISSGCSFGRERRGADYSEHNTYSSWTRKFGTCIFRRIGHTLSFPCREKGGENRVYTYSRKRRTHMHEFQS